MVLLSMNTNTGKIFSKFSDIEIKKQKFHFPKKGIHISKVDTTKIIVSEGFMWKMALSLMILLATNEIMKNCTIVHLNYTNESICKNVDDDRVLFSYVLRAVSASSVHFEK